ncbi:MAG: type I DNA topoisomerase [Anaerolineales bacterium]
MTILVIVESPTKAKSLRQYLGSGYTVRASLGHVRDLPPKELGVAVEAGFKPTYHLIPRARKTLAELRSAIESADTVLLATDPDREGEAIAWHIAQACSKDLRGKQVLRARFHEITPAAVKDAIAHPGALDMRLVDAQQARRVLDRLVGYQVSPVLWKGLAGPPGLSAGRVQSVALRLVVERDREIEAFVPEEYWTLDAELSRPPQGAPHFRARLYRIGKDKPLLKSKDEAAAVIEALQGADWKVGEVAKTRRTRNPYPPYITSTLQRDGSARLHWPAKKVMQIAQQLYEGVSLPGEGQAGLITYMRTDSTNVSLEAQREARQVIERIYGAEALPERPPVYAKKVKNAQEAHEAIRPTRPDRLPAAIREALSPDQDKLYTLIWRRFIASQMKPAVYNVTTVTVFTGRAGKRLPYIFRATGRELLEPGFLKVYDVSEPEAEAGESADNEQLPPLAAGDDLVLHQLIPDQHFTQPPPYFTDAALIQELERLGIGRPSTFANIVDTLYERGYADKVERSLRSSELGRAVCDFLVKHFPSVFEVGFTARLEDQLDDIANGEAKWTAVMAEMWAPLSALLVQAETAMAGQPKIRIAGVEPGAGWKGKGKRGGAKGGGKAYGRPRRAARKGAEGAGPAKAGATPTGEACPQCGQPLVARTSKFGPFVGCSGYPKCRYIAKADTKPGAKPAA